MPHSLIILRAVKFDWTVLKVRLWIGLHRIVVSLCVTCEEPMGVSNGTLSFITKWPGGTYITLGPTRLVKFDA